MTTPPASIHKIAIPALNSLRFRVPSTPFTPPQSTTLNAAVSITILEGTAELKGCELGVVTDLVEGDYEIWTWFGATVLIGGIQDIFKLKDEGMDGMLEEERIGTEATAPYWESREPWEMGESNSNAFATLTESNQHLGQNVAANVVDLQSQIQKNPRNFRKKLKGQQKMKTRRRARISLYNLSTLQLSIRSTLRQTLMH